MTKIVPVYFGAVLLLIGISGAWGQGLATQWGDEFLAKKQYEDEKFNGYFEYHLDKESIDELRVSGISEQKKQRLQDQEQHARDRREYIAQKKALLVLNDKEYEIEKRKLEQERAAAQREFISQKSLFLNYVKKNNFIPQEEELEIDVLYFTEQ